MYYKRSKTYKYFLISDLLLYAIGIFKKNKFFKK